MSAFSLDYTTQEEFANFLNEKLQIISDLLYKLHNDELFTNHQFREKVLIQIREIKKDILIGKTDFIRLERKNK